MATINDLPIADFASLTDEELSDLIRNIRARRSTPDPEIKAASVKKAVARKAKGRADALKDPAKMTKGLTPEQSKALLEELLNLKK